ncbi:hypothetical protein D8674_008409 [Pyrus ussuriensis x Pyrus communis]|uniref:Myb/SANT-like domain-containing protein n=1 Tax=Pyrus ussuriensis x Pyrus communis TaxID=2448454 RepID=A0A5N5HZL8_9ROSA|nr:hypothetical protein D8674_008409 [Pyrus ussuriensis x Pyrus communis]
MTKKGASSSNPTATWNAHNISIFCDVCIKEVEAGHRPKLVGKETGPGWNSSKGTVDASEEWWNNKIQINKEYGKLWKKGISPEMEDKLDRMFSNTIVTGEHAWAPSSGVLPPETRVIYKAN